MISVTAFLTTAVLGAIIYYLFGKDRNKKLPPGPFSLPIIGNALQILSDKQYLVFKNWAKTYGSIYQVKIATSRVVVLSDAKLIREAFNDPILTGRVDLESFNLLSGGPHGVLNSVGQEWVDQRRFTLRNLRDFGFGKNAMEGLIMEEVNEYLGHLKAKEGTEFSVRRSFSLAILNSLWYILTSKRYSQNDPKLVEFFDKNNKLAEELGTSPAIFLPSVAKMIPEWSGWNKLVALIDELRGIVMDSIDEHKKTIQYDGNPRDFTDSYLQEIKATTDTSSSFHGKTGDRSLLAVIGDLFGAGSETTSVTLSWAVLYLSKYPQLQKALQAEIDAVVGKNRQVSLADRPSLPYVEATILEVLRMSSIVPIGIFHTATTDYKFHGYDIPKGTWIASNLYAVHHDPANFHKPEEFRPTRFLSTDGKTVKRSDALIPFSVGKRACLGESLARDELFLFLSNIYQRFETTLAPQSKDVTCDPKPGFLLAPHEFKVILKER